MKGIENKVVIVTGSATLIGAGVLKAFHERGAKVAALDIDPKGKDIADTVSEDILFLQTDITKDDLITSAVNVVIEQFGRIDFLVNLACSYIDDGINANRDDWLTSYNVNVVSSVMLAKACHEQMKKQKGGAIVNFASISSDD